jgi:outer membrane murein-binding lipoprotein Lpp
VSLRARNRGKRLLAAVICGATLLAAGCGSDNEGKQLPQSSVSDLQTSLDSIKRRFEQGDGACNDITSGSDTDMAAVQAKLDALPSGVDKDVRDALQQSFQKLFDLVKQECKNTQTETTTTPTATTPAPPPPATTTTETTPTQTTTTQTNTTPSQGGEKQKGKGNGNKGNSNRNGNGNGNGNGGGGQGAGQGGGGGARAPRGG